jgi:short subunit dehydrogenase-like uncharacterized protein
MPFLLYGAYGYTGHLIARIATERGLQPTLAGRDAQKLRSVAEALDLPYEAVSLSDAERLGEVVSRFPLVLHAAGPFVHTAAPMVAACLATGAHYLDVTGEVAVFEALAAKGDEAKSAGVVVLPGVGFDVVPTDCLAAHLKQRLPSATHLALAIRGEGSVSRGTAMTVIENLGKGGLVREGGTLAPVSTAHKTRRVNFGLGGSRAVTIPWGDLATAYRSTGIPNIETYLALPPKAIARMQRARIAEPLLQFAPLRRAVQGFLKRRIDARPAGPSDEERESGASYCWGEAKDAEGRTATSRLTLKEGYTFTALAALTSAQRVLKSPPTPGYHTPSTAFGADFVLEIEGSRREDL